MRRCKESMHKWGYTTSSTLCDCGQEPQTMQHLLQCPLLGEACTPNDLAQNNQWARKCVQQWINVVDTTEEEDYSIGVTYHNMVRKLFTGNGKGSLTTAQSSAYWLASLIFASSCKISANTMLNYFPVLFWVMTQCFCH